jgi:sugar/nucleoside kinase (ribokinase family)/pantothenate kinase
MKSRQSGDRIHPVPGVTFDDEIAALAGAAAAAAQRAEGRFLLGIAGPPGSGKSLVADALAREAGGVVVPMDGFHLRNAELDRLGLRGRKGAPETFDVDGFAELLRRLRTERGAVAAPAFVRSLDEPSPGAIVVEPSVRLVVVEGNYLLLWPEVRALLDEVWFLDVERDVLRERLVRRWLDEGRTPDAAVRFVEESDLVNADLVRARADGADRRLALPERDFDVVVCGTCCLDVLVRPVPLDAALGDVGLLHTEAFELAAGGVVGNAGAALVQLGLRTAGLAYVGDDEWGPLLRARLAAAGIDTRWVATHASEPTSTTIALIDEAREHAFLHAGGASGALDAALVRAHLAEVARSRWLLVAYYGELPRLVDDLPELLAEVRARGCRTALDADSAGADLEPLARILPHLDAYVPSFAEAALQTGETEPERMVDVYRAHGAAGLVGVKLGARGALLSPEPDTYVAIAPVPPPRGVTHTIGAGDSFFAGLLAGLCRGLRVEEAGRVAAAAGACRVGDGGVPGFAETAALAGI